MQRITIKPWSCSIAGEGGGAASGFHIKVTYSHKKIMPRLRKNVIVHACERFDEYFFGREVTMETDHKPLEAILKKRLLTAPKRLQQKTMHLQNYQLKVVYKKDQEMYIADTFRRAYIQYRAKVTQAKCTNFVLCSRKLSRKVCAKV